MEVVDECSIRKKVLSRKVVEVVWIGEGLHELDMSAEVDKMDQLQEHTSSSNSKRVNPA